MAANILMEKAVRLPSGDDFVIQIEMRMSADVHFFGTVEFISRAQQLRTVVSLLTGVNSDEIEVLPANTSTAETVQEKALTLLLSIETQDSAYQNRHVQNLCAQVSDPSAPIRRRLQNMLRDLAQSWEEVQVDQNINVLGATLYRKRDRVSPAANRRLLGLESTVEVGDENSPETRAASLFVRSYNNTNNYDNLIAFAMNSMQGERDASNPHIYMRMCTISLVFSERAYCLENETSNLRAIDRIVQDGFRNSSNNSIFQCRAMALAPSQPTPCVEQKALRRLLSTDTDKLLLLNVELILFSEGPDTVHMTASRQLTSAGITRIILHDTKQARIFHVSFDSAVFDPDGGVYAVSPKSEKTPDQHTDSSTPVIITVVLLVFGCVVATVFFGWFHACGSKKKVDISTTHHVVVYQAMPYYPNSMHDPV